MENIYAFTDESGGYGFQFDKDNVTTHFVIISIIVKESECSNLQIDFEKIRKKYFPESELKSSTIGKNFKRRVEIINDIMDLPFSIFGIVVDKRILLKNAPGCEYKESFYKFLNNIMHKELRHAFRNITITADEIGGSEYMQSFCKYVKTHSETTDLFGSSSFGFKKSDNEVLIQLADFIAGTVLRCYDEFYKNRNEPNYLQLLDKKIIRLLKYPIEYENYVLEDSVLSSEFDIDIANICIKQAIDFINEHKESTDNEKQAQVIILKYLLFRVMNNDLRSYISTKELKKQLKNTELEDISTQTFRNRIIAKIRDAGVIISSSSSGYKIPTKKIELYDFINHGTTIIMPMLARLNKCREIIKLGTNNELDLFDNDAYRELKKIFDANKF